MLRKNNLQLKELKFYINNISRCLGIVVVLSTRRQYDQLNTIMKCSNIFKGILSINHNNIQQVSDIISISDQYTAQQ